MSQFDIALDAVVVTSTEITDDKKPILYVTHERDEETGEINWQFHSGSDSYDMKKMKLVRLDTILAIDPSVTDVADLPIGFAAVRQFAGAHWEISRD